MRTMTTLALAALLTTTGAVAQEAFSVVSAASFQEDLAPDMLATGFSTALAPGELLLGDSVPRPLELGGYTVTITDSTTVDRPAGLIFLADGQVNFIVPADTALGTATVTLRLEGQVVAQGTTGIGATAPGLITATSSGSGAPAGFLQTFPAEGAATADLLFETMTAQRAPVAFDISDASSQYFLLLFGTGIRGRTELAAVTATINGVDVPVAFAGAQGEFEALDQLNIGPLPIEALSGRGVVVVQIIVDGAAANAVEIAFGGPVLGMVPQLTGLDPATAAQGATFTLTLQGSDLAAATGIVFEPATGVTVGAFNAGSSSAEVMIASDAEAGMRMVRATSASGLSNAMEFSIMEGLPDGLTISNFELSASAGGFLGLVLGAQFDFFAPDGNIIWTGDIDTSAKTEVELKATDSDNVCTYIVAGAPLDFPGVVNGEFRLGSTPTFVQNEAVPGEGVATLTLIDPDGNRSNTLETEIMVSPLCPAGTPAREFTFP